MDLTNYVKFEKMKVMLLEQLEILGLREQARVINNNDLEKILYVLQTLGLALKDLPDKDKVAHLLNYIVGLLTKLVVDHGSELKDL